MWNAPEWHFSISPLPRWEDTCTKHLSPHLFFTNIQTVIMAKMMEHQMCEFSGITSDLLIIDLCARRAGLCVGEKKSSEMYKKDWKPRIIPKESSLLIQLTFLLSVLILGTDQILRTHWWALPGPCSHGSYILKRDYEQRPSYSRIKMIISCRDESCG